MAILNRKIAPAHGVKAWRQLWLERDKGMRAVIVVKLGITPVHSIALRPADFNHIGPFPAEEFLAEPDMNFSRSCRNDGIGRRVRTFNVAVGLGWRVSS
jgi:hypothetical protein